MVGPLLGCTGHIYYVHAALGAPCSDLDGAHREGRRKAEGAQRLHCICLGNAHTPTCFVRGIRKHPQVLNYIFFRRAGGSGGAEREREREAELPCDYGGHPPGVEREVTNLLEASLLDMDGRIAGSESDQDGTGRRAQRSRQLRASCGEEHRNAHAGRRVTGLFRSSPVGHRSGLLAPSRARLALGHRSTNLPQLYHHGRRSAVCACKCLALYERV